MPKTYFRSIVLVVSLIFTGHLYPADTAAIRSGTLDPPRKPAGSEITGPLSSPVLGYVAQAAPIELRAILGVPGSAVLSDPLYLPKGASRLRMAPDQSYALVERSAGDPQLLPLASGSATEVTITGALQAADFAAFSPKAQSAILYSSALARLQVITGLPGAPLISRDVDTSAFPEQPVNAAISDDAGSLLFGSSDAVYQLLPGGMALQLMRVAGAAALTFLPNSSQGIIADRGAGSVYLWQSDAGSAAKLADGLTGIGEMRPAADGQGLWFTNPAANAISWLSVTTAGLKTFNVPISPTKLDGLPHRDMFVIASDPGQPVWFLFQQEGDAMAGFVPAVSDKKLRIPGEGVRQ